MIESYIWLFYSVRPTLAPTVSIDDMRIILGNNFGGQKRSPADLELAFP